MVLAHVTIIYSPAIRIASRARITPREAAWYLHCLVKSGAVQSRSGNLSTEYRLQPKRRKSKWEF